MQQRLLEDQIAAHRKTKKALSAKQRTAKRAGRAFAEEDAAQLRYISEQQGAVQKQLEQVRKLTLTSFPPTDGNLQTTSTQGVYFIHRVM